MENAAAINDAVHRSDLQRPMKVGEGDQQWGEETKADTTPISAPQRRSRNKPSRNNNNNNNNINNNDKNVKREKTEDGQVSQV